MTDRNWEQELAKIDKQLASVSDEELLAQNAAAAQPTAQRAPLAAVPSAKSAPAAAKANAILNPTKSVGSWFAWVQLGVAVAAGVGLWFWPWASRCGLNAVGFTAATGAVTLLGLWSAIGSWRHRKAYAHVLSFVVMIWGLVLGAREVLPRMGYAIPTVDRPAGWSCEATPSLPGVPLTQPTPAPGSGPVTNPPNPGKP